MLFAMVGSAILADRIANIGPMFVVGLAERWAAAADCVAQRSLETRPAGVVGAVVRTRRLGVVGALTAHIGIANA